MARKVISRQSGSGGARDGLRDRKKKVEYNEHKLAVAASFVPKPAKKKATVKKVAAKKGKKGTTYLVLVKRALKDVEAPGWGVESILNSLVANNPDKNNRRYIRQALNSGVEKKIFIKTKGSYRLSKKAQEKMSRTDKKKKEAAKAKKAATKKTDGKKSATKKTTKKTGTKKTATKKTATKKTATKKTATKKSTTKKEGATKKKVTTKKAATKKTDKKEKAPVKRVSKKKAEDSSSASSPKKAKKGKKVIGPSGSDESSSAVSEAAGVWQYYDGGWHNYASDASLIVEGVYKEFIAAGEGSGLDIRAIQSGHFSYMINFREMEQTNTQTGTKRKIKRV